MSYAEYLRTKAAGSQKILNSKKPTDASAYIDKLRHSHSGVSPVDGIFGTTRTATDRPNMLGRSHPNMSFRKATGRPQDASMFTAYRGSQGIRNDAAFNRGRINDASQCYTIAPTEPSMNASSVTKNIEVCRIAQQGHKAPGVKLGPSMFVDNTISLNGYDRCAVLPVNHNVKDVTREVVHPAPGFKQLPQILPIGVPPLVGGIPPKQGAASDNIRMIGKHHGNPLVGNQHFLPVMPFRPAQRGPRHINEPMMGQIK
jgi:hypothetical protein